VGFVLCRKCRSGMPAGERARSGRVGASRLVRGAPPCPLGTAHETLRLPAFRFLIFFVLPFLPFRHCERSEAIQPFEQAALDCFVAPLLAMTAYLASLFDIVGCEFER
jgi:hypothetical protein